MDSHILERGFNGADSSYTSYYSASYMPTRLIGSLDSDSRNSFYSPFSTPFETGAVAFNVLMDNPEVFDRSFDSSVDHNNHLQQHPCISPSSHQYQADNYYDHPSILRDDNLEAKTEDKFVLWKGISPYGLKHHLIECAKFLDENRLSEFEKLLELARSSVSITGEPIQRLGAYLLEGLVARKESSGSNIYRALKCDEPDGKDMLSYMHTLFEVCPYFKFGYMAANGAIAEACRKENRIHIIDFQIALGTQWITLLQALAKRPSGAPHMRITGIDLCTSENGLGNTFSFAGKRLAEISKQFNIPIEFIGISVSATDLTREMIDVRPNESVVVNFPLLLHHIPDESVDLHNPRDGILRMVKSLSPKVVTMVEQESNTNTSPFLPRFIETLDYYLAMFESLDVTMPRDDKERINVEQHCLAKDVVNVIACEANERIERHEVFGKWRSRFTMAGFRQLPMSSYVNSVIKGLLRNYSDDYNLTEKDGAMFLGWKHRNMISASAWY